jgi:D-3-phosphoglycerate dehydrogenase / 2-oxoglutarate reductase
MTTILIADPNEASEGYAPEQAVAAAYGAELIIGASARRPSDAEVILISALPMSADVLQTLTRCALIVRYGIGVDIIDVAAATAHGIVVANAPTYCLSEVADHAAGLILGFARRIPWLDRQVHAHAWAAAGSCARGVRRLDALTLGLIGMGRIGRLLVRRMIPFGMRITAHDAHLGPAAIEELGAIPVTLEEVLRESDFLSLHVPLVASTYHLIDEAALRLMKPSAVLINTSRGPVVDEAALIRALQEDRLFGAALDVLEREPPEPDNPLLAMDSRRVILTPHFAASSEESVAQLHREVADAVESFLRGRWPRATINPQVVPRTSLSW